MFILATLAGIHAVRARSASERNICTEDLTSCDETLWWQSDDGYSLLQIEVGRYQAPVQSYREVTEQATSFNPTDWQGNLYIRAVALVTPALALVALLSLAVGGSPASTVLAKLKQRAEHMSTFELIMLNLGNFGCAFFWFCLQIQIVPSQIRALAGDTAKSSDLGFVAGVGAAITFVGSPWLGNLVDTAHSRIPFVLVGLCGSFIYLMFLALASPNIPPQGEVRTPLPSWGLAWYTICYGLLNTFFLILSVPYQAHLATCTPCTQRGHSSGINAMLNAAGNLMAAAVGLRYVSIGNIFISTGLNSLVLSTSFILMMTLGPSMISRRYEKTSGFETTASNAVENSNEDPKAPLSIVNILAAYTEPLHDNDFFWVFFTRFLMQQGIATVSWFLQYFIHDVVHPVGMREETAVSMCFLPMLVLASVSALFGGWLSDYMGGKRKMLVILSALLMGACALVFAFWTSSLLTCCIVMGVFGIGYGMFLAVDFALVMDVLPSDADVSRDMAIWHNASILPQMLATPIGGALRDAVGGEAGYTALFIVSGSYFLLSAAFVTRVSKVA